MTARWDDWEHIIKLEPDKTLAEGETFEDKGEIRRFEPGRSASEVDRLRSRWREAVVRSTRWEAPEEG